MRENTVLTAYFTRRNRRVEENVRYTVYEHTRAEDVEHVEDALKPAQAIRRTVHVSRP